MSVRLVISLHHLIYSSLFSSSHTHRAQHHMDHTALRLNLHAVLFITREVRFFQSSRLHNLAELLVTLVHLLQLVLSSQIVTKVPISYHCVLTLRHRNRSITALSLNVRHFTTSHRWTAPEEEIILVVVVFQSAENFVIS